MKNILVKKTALITITILLSASYLKAAAPINETFLKNINTDGDETSCAIASGGKYFIFSRKLKGSDTGDFYFSEYKNGKWTDSAAASDLNSDSDEISPYFSADGKLILFSSNRPGSLKNAGAVKPSYDIYYSVRKKGGWEKPELLFGAVNTTDDELNPYITKDGKVLYFTRSPLNDNTKATIIKTYNRDDSWEDISTVDISKNPAYNIYMYKKSSYKPGYYIIASKKADPAKRDVYFSDESGSSIIELNSSKDPLKTAGDGISFTELNKETVIVSSNSSGKAEGYDFIIKKIDTASQKELPKTISLKVESGNYSNPGGVKVNVLFFSSLKKNSWPAKTETKSPDSSGMISVRVNPGIKRVLVLPGDAGMKSFSVEFITGKENITTSTIKIESAAEKEFSPEPVYFGFNSSEIQIADIPYLHGLIDYMRKNQNTRLSLLGYADGIGSYKANLDLSVRRAEKIKDYIVKAGISKKRIQTKGNGYLKEKSPDTSQFNRRVESILISR